MRAKPTSEYLDFAETFPTAIAEAMGNSWTAQDVLNAVKELRLLALIGDPLTSDEHPPNPPFGALPPM